MTAVAKRSPAAITPKKKLLLLDAYASGATQRIACGVARVAPRTLQTWLKRGREELDEWAEECEQIADTGGPRPPWPTLSSYAGFYLEIAQAVANRDLRWLKKLEGWDEKGQGWTKYAWLLERTSPGEFALRDGRLDPHADGGPAKTEDRSASLADFARLLEAVGALAKLGRGADPAEVPARRALLPAPRNS